MKTIVAATDFSPAANRAAQVAARLAVTHQASLVLVNAFRFWPTNPAELGGDFPLSAQFMRDDSQRQLEQLAEVIRAQNGNSLSVRCVVREGYVISELNDVAEQEKADLLVMSTVGTAPQSAQLMGSVATAMVAETRVPLLLIPPSAPSAQFRNVVFGIDLDTPPNAVVFDAALRFARQFGCVVNVLCVNNEADTDANKLKAEHLRHLMANVPHTFTVLPGEEVYSTLLQFATDNKADLIMMLPQPHSWLRKLFVEGHTERVARLTNVPLLAVV